MKEISLITLISVQLIFSCGSVQKENSQFRDDQEANNNKSLLLIGTYTEGNSNGEGILLYSLDKDGELEFINKFEDISNPTYLVIHPTKNLFYSVSEQENGQVASFSIDKITGEMKLLNLVSSGGNGPCHISIDSTGSFVYVANYGSGSVSSFTIEKDGKLSKATSIHQHYGNGPLKKRQEGPHAHMIVPSQNQEFAYAIDLGIDEMLKYEISNDGKLNYVEGKKLLSGEGPRHLVFHPTKQITYVIHEFSNRILVLNENMDSIQTIKTTSKDFEILTVTSAAIKIHPNGKFLYTSNRSQNFENTIATFKIDQKSALLELVSTMSSEGKSPRDFAISPNGKFLLIANQETNNLVVFEIDPKTGVPMNMLDEYKISTPVCLKFWSE